ncbi:MAG: hypothetical protein GY786_06170 [Proteobacteria bacterium]|nr:hypothetical protein [Pseudomonadota bacterium]
MDTMNYDQVLDLLQKRRSTRRFKSDPVPKETIEKIIEAARWAPSGFDTQPWEFVVVTEEADRKKVVEITSSYWVDCAEMEKARPSWQGKTWKLKGMTNEPGDYSHAPVYIIMFGDPRVLDALPMGVQCDRHRKRLIYQSSLANAFLYMHLAATSFGLGSQWYSSVQTPKNSCLIKDYFGVPDEFDVYDMMVLGHPARHPSKKFNRKLEEMIHWGRDGNNKFRDQSQVRDFVKKARAWVTGVHAKKAKDI